MTTEDRDSLARIIFTAKSQSGWQEWGTTSDGVRGWCRAKAHEAMAAGWRKVGADQVVVSGEDFNEILVGLRTLVALSPRLGDEGNWGVLATRLAALADPAGANGGE